MNEMPNTPEQSNDIGRLISQEVVRQPEPEGLGVPVSVLENADKQTVMNVKGKLRQKIDEFGKSGEPGSNLSTASRQLFGSLEKYQEGNLEALEDVDELRLMMEGGVKLPLPGTPGYDKIAKILDERVTKDVMEAAGGRENYLKLATENGLKIQQGERDAAHELASVKAEQFKKLSEKLGVDTKKKSVLKRVSSWLGFSN